jgi:hypothetical protein
MYSAHNALYTFLESSGLKTLGVIQGCAYDTMATGVSLASNSTSGSHLLVVSQIIWYSSIVLPIMGNLCQ